MADIEPGDAHVERPEEINPLLRWREYLHVLYERRWIAITTFAVTVICTALWNLRQAPVYRARARLQVAMSAERIMNIPDLSAQGTPGYMFGQYLGTMIKALRSRTFIEQVAESLRTSDDPAKRALAARSPNLAARIMQGLSVASVEGTMLIDVSVEDGDAEGMQQTFSRAKAARDGFSAILAERGQGGKAE